MTAKRSVPRRRHHQRRNENAKKFCGQTSTCRDPKNPDFHRIRLRQKCLRVSDLVYKFLENVANANDNRRQRNNARTNFQRAHVRKYSRQNRRPDDPKSTDKILKQTQYEIPKKSCLGSNFPNCKICKNSHASETFAKKSSSQFVEDYIEAANKSKRRAERSIRKALSFGVDTGFLPTAGSSANIFRVSSSLDVKVMGENMDWSKETEADDHKNQKINFFQRGKRRNPKSYRSTSLATMKKRSKSMSGKLWNKKKHIKPRRKEGKS